jgi:hypothetical protein
MSENIWIKRVNNSIWSVKLARTLRDRVEYLEVESEKFYDIKKIINNKLKKQLLTSANSLKYSIRILLKRAEAKLEGETTFIYDEAEFGDGDMHAVGSIATTGNNNDFSTYPRTHSKIIEYLRRHDKPFFKKLVSLGQVLDHEDFESTALGVFGLHAESIILKETWDVFALNKALGRMMITKDIESSVSKEDYSEFERWRNIYSD